MDTRPGCRVHAIIVISCHGNDDEAPHPYIFFQTALVREMGITLYSSKGIKNDVGMGLLV